MKKSVLSFILFGAFVFAQDSTLLAPQELENAELKDSGHKKTLIEKIKEKELELQVPRESVPVTESRYPIKTAIPKTAYYLPMLQTLLHIEPGTLPNPLGISIIGSYTMENYRVKKFSGQMGANLGTKIGGLFDQIPANFKIPVKLPILGQTNITIPLFGTLGVLSTKTQADFIADLKSQLNNAFGTNTKEWKLSDGTVSTKTSAIGAKIDMYLFPFMNLFATATYLHVEQETRVGSATIPLDNPITITLDGTAFGNQPQTITLNEITFPVGSVKNILDGYAVMGGTNVAIGYKGFFASCMVGGGYVQLDDWQNNVSGFVQKPFMYVAPRIGYTYDGIFTMHAGVQRIELFGSTKGKDLSASSGGLVQSYAVELDKFPINFLAGAQFMPMRDFGISLEYVGSPDTSGINAEVAYRF
ncbi:hypothetical protein [uncultured Helicobacter sp.]|uniref:hypothetical protein n=1 Tax=uncultured Helicobacter sp. TaxID=175537 RepID=UPI002621811C|nr:hypothetical protein [uncultured Helicobacter sp.]